MRAQGGVGPAFTTFDAPGAGTGMFQGTASVSINATGTVAGIYVDADIVAHGFLRAANGATTSFDASGAGTKATQGTFPISINAAGEVAGMYSDANNVYHGFLRATDGSITVIDAPNAGTGGHRGTIPTSIDAAGDVAGIYKDANDVHHGFLRAANGTMTAPLDAPGAGTGMTQGTTPISMNSAKVIVGLYKDAGGLNHGFMRSASGTFTTMDAAGAGMYSGGIKDFCCGGTSPLSIDAAGDVTGFYTDTSGVSHGFLLPAGGTMIAPIDVPGASTTGSLFAGTVPFTVNDSGALAGFYSDNGVAHCFLRAANGTILAPLDDPRAGAAGTSLLPGTFGISINDFEEVAGFYADANGTLHGFLLLPAPAATPTFSLPSGTYTSAQQVTISDATPASAFYYTTNGTTPTTASTLYTGAITVSSTETIEAIAVAGAYANSAAATATYTISATPVAATPSFSIPSGTYMSAQQVTISDATAGATIYYTTNGTTPTTSSTPYTGAITVSSSETIEAIATANGYSNSAVATATYTITGTPPQAATPTFLLTPGNYLSAQSVAITDATPGATIYYTTNATTPSTSSTLYTGAITVTSTETIEAIAAAAGYSNSTAATATYTIAPSAAGEWTWVNGSNSANHPGIYGTKGTAAASNVPGGRDGAAGWTDAAGDFWLFGGGCYAFVSGTGAWGACNDLWEYGAGQWTWIGGSNGLNQKGTYGNQGTPAAGNIPGARGGAVSWTDAAGNFWFFGGNGYDSAGTNGSLNDLWEYSAGEWTWMGGSNVVNTLGTYGAQGVAAAGNIPGARYNAVSWTDAAGNFWLFGGTGYDSAGANGNLDDLWKYSGGQWTWVGGSNVVGQKGTYGTQGTAATSNIPGARNSAASWTDPSGNFWLFGGLGYDSAGASAFLNDLWKYSADQWTWMGGSKVVNQVGTYGTQGTAAAGNIPGARNGAETWIDMSGNFWLFGGQDFNSADTAVSLNDLWEYSAGQWTWVGGSNVASQPGVYGTQGTPAAGNVPGARMYGTNWTDATGNFWSFGGYQFAVGSTGPLNDLWEYQPSATVVMAAKPAFVVAPGSSTPGSYSSPQMVTISDATVGATIYYTTNGTTPTTASTRYTGAIMVNSTETIEAIAVAGGYSNSLVATATYSLQVATPLFSLASGNYTSTQTVMISDATAGATIYYTTNGTTPTTASTQYTGQITVNSAETIEAIAAASGYSNSLVTSTTYTFNPYTIGGTVSGLSGTGLVLQNNSGNNLPVSSNGNFAFTTPVASGGAYSVTVLTQPTGPAQNCVVKNGTGTASANVTNVQVTCTTINLPAITSLTPALIKAGSSAFSLVVNGSNFFGGATVLWNGSSLGTTFVSQSQLQASVPSANILSAGIANIAVANAASAGGATSGAFSFVIDTATGAVGGFTVSSTTTTLTVQHGQPTQLQVTFTGVAAGATVTASCVNLPLGASCSYSNGIVTIATSATTPTGSYAVIVIFTATQQTTAMANVGHDYFAALFGFVGLPLGLLWVGVGGRKKIARRCLILVFGLLLILPLASCGGGSGSSSQPTQTTTTTQSSLPLTLIVD